MEDVARSAFSPYLQLADRFWPRVTPPDERGCRFWTGANVRGVGRLRMSGRLTLAHRVAWTLEHGPIPGDHDVIHTCGFGRCVAAAHLRLALSVRPGPAHAGIPRRAEAAVAAPEAPGDSTATACHRCFNRTVLPLTDGQCIACQFSDQTKADEVAMRGHVTSCRAMGACVYCGDPATDVEHVVPRASGLPTWTVPACGDCNSRAGDFVFPTFAAKQEWIRERIRRDYRAVLRTPAWTQAEIDGMGHGLRAAIRTHSALAAVLVRRLTWQPLDGPP